MIFDQIQVPTKGGNTMTLKDVMADVVKVHHVDDDNNATVIRANNIREVIRIAPGQQWIANNPA